MGARRASKSAAKGDPNSLQKLRAKRMRAERKAKEALANGEAIPADVLATIQELGGTVPTAMHLVLNANRIGAPGGGPILGR